MRNKRIINETKETVMKLNTEELGFDPTDIEELGVGAKTTAHNDMGQRATKVDALDDLYTNDFWRDTPEWEGGDALAEVAEWEGDNFAF